MSEELKPCPCCGRIKSLFFYDYPIGAFAVCCVSCGMRGPSTGYSKDEAIKTWNSLPRHSDIERVERERDWLAVNLANGLVDPGCIEHLAELGGMSPPDPATLIEAAKEATHGV